MSSLDKAFKEEVKKVPRIILTEMIQNKLDGMGLNEKSGLAEALVEHIESGSEEKFLWNDGGDSDEAYQDYELVITDEDLAKFENDLSEFLKGGLKNLVEDTTDDAARDVLRSLKSQWPEVDETEEAMFFLFRENLEDRWGKAFSLLRMMYSIAREMGESAEKRWRKSRAKKNRTLRMVLLRLHARACQIAAEIITLIENGFADGAMARWRTLHELYVVASVLVEGGEELAERYVDHEIIESKAGMDELERCHESLGYKPISTRDKRRIEKGYAAAIKKYGKEFGSPYGWASKFLQLKKPILKDLEAVASHSHMRSHYKFASQNVHAGAKGIFYRLSSIDNESDVFAGASNAGFEEPAQNTAISLMQITGLLNHERMSKVDVIVELKTLLLLSDEISTEFVRAARRLQRDERAIRRDQPVK